jgi:endoglucanase
VKATGGVTATGGAGGSLPWLKVVGNQIQIEATGQQVILRGLSLQGIGTQNNNAVIDYLTNTNDTQGTSPGWYPKILRLPVDTPNPNNEINGVLKSTVDYATKKGLYAIVDLHYVANPYQNDAAVKSFWTIVAPMFKDYPNVIYEPFNESDVQDSWATYKPTMQAWVDLIRSYAPKNLIFAGSPAWDQTMGDAGLNPLAGTNIVYTVHMYEQHYYSAWNRGQVEACAKYHPVVMTEWGFNHELSQPGYGTNIIGSYGQPMLTWLEAMGGSWTAWCASSSWLPDMFTGSGPQNWVLRTGQDNMGGFVKDWLYTYRNNKAPF